MVKYARDNDAMILVSISEGEVNECDVDRGNTVHTLIKLHIAGDFENQAKEEKNLKRGSGLTDEP